MDEGLKVLKANKNFVMMVKGSLSLLNSGKLLLSEILEEGSASIAKLLVKAKSTNRPVVSKELTEIVKSEIIRYTCKIVPFESHYLIFFRDLTVEYKIHQQLRLADKLSHSLIESPFFENQISLTKGIADHLNQILMKTLSEVNELKKADPSYKLPKSLGQEFNKLGNISRILNKLSLHKRTEVQIQDVKTFLDHFIKHHVHTLPHWNNRQIELDIDDDLHTEKILTQPEFLSDMIGTGLSNALEAIEGSKDSRILIAFILKKTDMGQCLLISIKNPTTSPPVMDSKPFTSSKDSHLGSGLYLASVLADYLGAELSIVHSRPVFQFEVILPILSSDQSKAGGKFLILTDDNMLAFRAQKLAKFFDIPFTLFHPDSSDSMEKYVFSKTDNLFVDLFATSFSPVIFEEKIRKKELKKNQIIGLGDDEKSKGIFDGMVVIKREIEFKDLQQIL